MVHRYGPHIFHTVDERVSAYVNRFATMVPFNHRVRTTVQGRLYLLPVDLLTVNQLFSSASRPARRGRSSPTGRPLDQQAPQLEEQR